MQPRPQKNYEQRLNWTSNWLTKAHLKMMSLPTPPRMPGGSSPFLATRHTCGTA